MTLHSNHCFLPKGSSDIIWDIQLPVFYSKPNSSKEEAIFYTLDIIRAVALYLLRTKSFRVSPRLFVSFAKRMRDHSISVQRLTK